MEVGGTSTCESQESYANSESSESNTSSLVKQNNDSIIDSDNKYISEVTKIVDKHATQIEKNIIIDLENDQNVRSGIKRRLGSGGPVPKIKKSRRNIFETKSISSISSVNAALQSESTESNRVNEYIDRSVILCDNVKKDFASVLLEADNESNDIIVVKGSPVQQINFVKNIAQCSKNFNDVPMKILDAESIITPESNSVLLTKDVSNNYSILNKNQSISSSEDPPIVLPHNKKLQVPEISLRQEVNNFVNKTLANDFSPEAISDDCVSAKPNLGEKNTDIAIISNCAPIIPVLQDEIIDLADQTNYHMLPKPNQNDTENNDCVKEISPVTGVDPIISNYPKKHEIGPSEEPLLQLIETTQKPTLVTNKNKKVVTRLIPIVLEDDWELDNDSKSTKNISQELTKTKAVDVSEHFNIYDGVSDSAKIADLLETDKISCDSSVTGVDILVSKPLTETAAISDETGMGPTGIIETVRISDTLVESDESMEYDKHSDDKSEAVSITAKLSGSVNNDNEERVINNSRMSDSKCDKENDEASKAVEKNIVFSSPSDVFNKTKESNSDIDSDPEISNKKSPQKRAGGSVTELSAKPKVKNLRRNIRDIIGEDKLEENTLAAQKEEQLRLQRLQEKRSAMREYIEQQQEEKLIAEVAEVAEAAVAVAIKDEDEEIIEDNEKVHEEMPTVKIEDTDIVVLSSEDEKESDTSDDEDLDDKKKSDMDSDQKSGLSDESDSDSDIMVLSQSEEEEDNEDANNSGSHINDEFNVPDAQFRVLVNVGHPENEPDIFLPNQLASVVKPHQIGGIRFLYDNIIESVEQYKTSNGFGCILAHSMGLGKTLQVVTFSDIFMRHTEAKNVLIIVPINTIQNWLAEYNQWIPEVRPPNVPEDFEIRNFKVFILNDAQKNLKSRYKVISSWHENGGILLMGYELYRQLSLKKQKKPKKKKKRKDDNNSEIVDVEEEDQDKVLLDEIHKYLVRPGPDLVICDEGHRIKNAHAHISQALKNIRTKRRVVLTGYPLQNNLIEYWCMVDFIRPNYLGTKTEFSNMFERPIQNGQCVDSTPQDGKIMRYRAHV